MSTMLRDVAYRFGSVLILLALAMGALQAQGQPISLSRQFNTPGIDRATDVTADASGI
jgi:hypothetical protein